MPVPSIFINLNLKAANRLQFYLVTTHGRVWPGTSSNSGRKRSGLTALSLILDNNISLFPYDKNGFLEELKKCQPKQSMTMQNTQESIFQANPKPTSLRNRNKFILLA